MQLTFFATTGTALTQITTSVVVSPENATPSRARQDSSPSGTMNTSIVLAGGVMIMTEMYVVIRWQHATHIRHLSDTLRSQILPISSARIPRAHSKKIWSLALFKKAGVPCSIAPQDTSSGMTQLTYCAMTRIAQILTITGAVVRNTNASQ
jgi:hypothetical protein